MSVAMPSAAEIRFLLGLPGADPRSLPLRDRDADPGWFGPDSETWRVLGTPLLLLGGTRALLMQVAHPLVAEGVLQHSDVAGDPFGRLMRTAQWVVAVAFGTTAEAERAVRITGAVHKRVTGTLPAENATVRVPAGTPFDARDPELVRWVHATLVDSFLAAHEALRGPLPAHRADRLVREWNRVAVAQGVAPDKLWRSRAELRRYVEEQIARGPVHAGAGSRAVARTVLDSPFPHAAARRAWPAVHLFSLGLLSPELREQFGVRWGAADRVAHRAVTASLRATLAVTPRRLREPAVVTFARRRSQAALGG